MEEIMNSHFGNVVMSLFSNANRMAFIGTSDMAETKSGVWRTLSDFLNGEGWPYAIFIFIVITVTVFFPLMGWIRELLSDPDIKFINVNKEKIIDELSMHVNTPEERKTVRESITSASFCNICGSFVAEGKEWRIAVTFFSNRSAHMGDTHHQHNGYVFDCEECYKKGKKMLAHFISKNMKNYPVGGEVILNMPNCAQESQSLLGFALSSAPILTKGIKRILFAIFILGMSFLCYWFISKQN
jgi:hypothetical protein